MSLNNNRLFTIARLFLQRSDRIINGSYCIFLPKSSSRRRITFQILCQRFRTIRFTKIYRTLAFVRNMRVSYKQRDTDRFITVIATLYHLKCDGNLREQQQNECSYYNAFIYRIYLQIFMRQSNYIQSLYRTLSITFLFQYFQQMTNGISYTQ